MRKLLAIIVMLPGMALGQVPSRIAYQGRLLQSGAPQTGTASVTFSLFSSATGGTALWTETQTVTFSNGFYSVYLGDATGSAGCTPSTCTGIPASVFSGSELFLDLAVSGTTLTPRQRVDSVPYAVASYNVTGGAVNASSVTVGGANGVSISSTGISVNGAALGFPAGVVVPFAGSTPPSGWLLCDGSAVSRTTYPQLLTAIGVTYGAGDGLTTFNVPDLRGRMVVGQGQGTGLTNRALASTGGEEQHVLVVGEMPSHTHTVAEVNPPCGGVVGGCTNTPAAAPGGGTPAPTTSSATGGGLPHNTMAPFVVLNYIIKF